LVINLFRNILSFKVSISVPQNKSQNLEALDSQLTSSRIPRAFILTALPSVLISIAILIVATLVPNLSIILTSLLILAGATLVVAPRFGIVLFLVLIPVLGNRPGTPHAYALLLLACWINLAVLFHLVKSAVVREKLSAIPYNPIAFLCILYVIASIMSLTGLPLAEWFFNLRSSTPALSDTSALAYRLSRFLIPTEESIDYSILSVFLTVSAFNFLLLIFMFPATVKYSFAILAGLLISLLVGLLDYYGLVDLRFFRPLDPVVNPGDVQFRLQSFFGHSGWFAQYVTLAVPFVLLLLALPLKFGIRVSLLFAVLIVGEFVLILTFQRGGWLSYPITLLAVWSAIYLHKHFERGTENLFSVFKKSCLKICVCLPVTVILSLGVIAFLNHHNLLGHDARSSIDSYAQRFQDITKAADRTAFMKAGYLLGKDYPILGRGSESFAFHYDREFRDPSGKYYDQIVLPLFGSAHNVYFQTFAGKGAIGLLLLLAILIATATLALRRVFLDRSLDAHARLILLASCCFVAAFLIYGNVQEIFYVQSLQFLFFAIIAIGGFYLGPVRGSLKRFMWPTGLGVLLVAFLLHASILPGIAQISLVDRTTGCYRPETDPSGQKFIWCGPRSRLALTMSEIQSEDRLELSIQAAPFSLTEHGIPPTMRILHKGDPVFETSLKPGESALWSIPSDLFEASSSDASQRVVLDIHFSGYVIPRRDITGSDDPRALSYRLFLPARD